jgi:hypothetical protein
MDCFVPLASLGLLAMTAAPRFSKPFQGFPNFSKEIPNFSKLFPRKFQGFPNFFLGRFEENQGVIAQSARNRVFSNFRAASAAGRAARR